MRLLIWPDPSADEAAAIHSAISKLMARTAVSGRRLRYGDVARTRDGAADNDPHEAVAHALRRLTWKDAARLASLDDGV
jgi:hypothetical protein